nr:CaiB/BaiF CoA-transferase family protein [Kibdelosporangium sp. MJ126-NF4]CEL12954.1 L-carnitine dehydratase/bile acid-inducible protein F [Kibdelosporangium sp. MJ126-NF4]CTQ98639.1 L-carnitine dehydratase/bile acid-inducible protein F [Kibdelosporangium sp. MJ126-NF4]
MLPLSGITVLDFSRVLAGPMATQVLAELGADVIKVERPGSGDESRQMQPVLPSGESAYYFAFNRGKRSVAIDLKTDHGRQLATDLATTVDVVVENFLPGGMERLGLGYSELSAANPGLVYVSCTGFGQHGPYSGRKGYDTVFQALSGLMALTGHPDSPPAKAGVPVADMTSGLWIAIAVLTGLVGRGNTGSGRHMDLSMMDVQVSLLALAAARLFALDEDPRRTGTEHPGRVPSAAFVCSDGKWLHISCSDQHWLPLCETMGVPDLAEDKDLRHNAGRLTQRARVMSVLAAAFAQRPRAELAASLRAAGVPVGEVNTVREILTDENTVGRGMVGDFDHPVAGSFPALRTPLRMSDIDSYAALPVGTPPRLGADTGDVLRDRLGLSDSEIDALRREGAIG